MQQFQAPSPLSLTGNPAENWNSWEQRFRRHIAALEEKDEQVKIDILLNTIGEDAPEVYNRLTVRPEGDELTMEDVLRAFKDHCRATEQEHIEQEVQEFPVEGELKVILPDKSLHHNTNRQPGSQSVPNTNTAFTTKVQWHTLQLQQPSVTDCVFSERNNVELPECLHLKEEPEMLSEEQEESSAVSPVKYEDEEEKSQASHLYWRQIREITIKEESEILNEEQEENQLCVYKETYSDVSPVKYEDEKLQASHVHWRKQTEINIKEEPSTCTLDELMKSHSVGINSKGPEAAQNPHPSSLVLECTDGTETDSPQADDSSEDEEDDDEGCWQKPLSESETEDDIDSTRKKRKVSSKTWISSFQQICSKKKLQIKMTSECVGGKKAPLSAASTGEKPFECDVCRKCFIIKSHLKRHMRIHTGEKPYKCDVCSRCFNNRVNHMRHMVIHSREKPFECDICSACFKNRVNLMRHMRIHTGEKPFQCDVCSQFFTRKVSLDVHMRTHTGEKPFKCDVCGRGFIRKTGLQSHMKNHTGEKTIKCDVCRKCFNFNGDLKKHMITHSGEKPFKCDVCLKSFARKDYLQSHMRIHTGEKPFQCDVCSKCFSFKVTCMRHMEIHTGEKLIKCDICNKRFNQKSYLRRHMKTHTEEEPLKCDV